MTSSQTLAILPAMIAHAEGKPVQKRPLGAAAQDPWLDDNDPDFNPRHNWRPKPEPLRLWAALTGGGNVFEGHLTKFTCSEYQVREFVEVVK